MGHGIKRCFNPFHPEFTIVNEFTANCCRNSRLVMDEDDLMWFRN